MLRFNSVRHTSALGDEDLYGCGHGVGGLARVVARVGGRGLLESDGHTHVRTWSQIATSGHTW